MIGALVFFMLIFPNPSHPRLVKVKDCDGRFIPIYADREGRRPMANPVVTDANGKVTFWAQSGCVWMDPK